jgi:hypothetical protein
MTSCIRLNELGGEECCAWSIDGRRGASGPTPADQAKLLYPAALSTAVLEQVVAPAVRGNLLKPHRLGTYKTGNERYERAPVIVHRTSNSRRNRSFGRDGVAASSLDIPAAPTGDKQGEFSAASTSHGLDTPPPSRALLTTARAGAPLQP